VSTIDGLTRSKLKASHDIIHAEMEIALKLELMSFKKLPEHEDGHCW
jgi:hypothetical protein